MLLGHYPTTLYVNKLDKYFIWYYYHSSPSINEGPGWFNELGNWIT